MNDNIYLKCDGDFLQYISSIDSIRLVPYDSYVKKTQDKSTHLKYIEVGRFVDHIVIEERVHCVEGDDKSKAFSMFKHGANNQFGILLGTIKLLDKVLGKEELDRSEMIMKNIDDLKKSVNILRVMIGEIDQEINKKM
jgi:hypothetical protein